MTPSKDDSSAVANPVNDSARAAGAEMAGGASLEKVRDILFGVQIREFERRFARLEERLVKETSDLKDDVKKRLDALELYAKNETESLAGRMRAEHDERMEANGDLSRDLKESARAFERRTTSLDEQMAQSQREFRHQMLEQYQRVTDDIRQKVDDVLATLAREAQELRTDKADRTVLASLLSEMALRLTNELTIPGAEDLGNG